MVDAPAGRAGSLFEPARGYSVRLSRHTAAELLAVDQSQRCFGLSEASRLRSGCDLECRRQNILPNLAWSCFFNGSHAQKSNWSEWQSGRYSRISHLVYL